MIEIEKLDKMNYGFLKKDIIIYIEKILNNKKLSYDEKYDIICEFIEDNKVIEKWKSIRKDFDNC